MTSLQSQVRSAYMWTFGGNAVKQALSFGLSMLLARFLSPGDYGLVGMVAVFVTLLSAVQDLGIGRAVIYFPDAESSFATFCSISTASGLVLAAALFFSAPAIASFYGSAGLVPIVRWLSLTLLFGALRSASQSLIIKKLLFRKLTLIEGTCTLSSAAIAVYLAWRGFGVWSLVTNLVLSSALNTIIVLVAVPPRYTLRPDLRLMRKILGWGMPLVGSSCLCSFYDNADDLVVGKLLANTELGFYSLAFRLATLVNERIGAIISRVSFPTFAAMQADRSLIVRHWLSVTRKSALLSFPFLVLLAVSARDLISVMLGPKWLPTVAPLRLLCVVGALRVLTPIMINLLPALGRSTLAFWYSFANSLLMPISFFFGCKMGGIVGVGWAWLLVFPLIAAGLTRQTLRLTGVSWAAYLTNLRFPALTSLAMLAASSPFLYLLPPGLLRLLACPAAGVLAFTACLLLTTAGRQIVPQRVLTIGNALPLGRLKLFPLPHATDAR